MIGTPGTGKRAVGHFLEQHAGFAYLDFENAETRRRYLESGTGELRAEISARAGRGVVITWAAGPTDRLREIKRLESLGFEPIWFDSDRGAACQAQFSADLRRVPRFHFVDTFERDGRFRPVEGVVAELLEPRARVRPQPVRDLVAAAGRALVPRVAARRVAAGLSWRVAGGLALATGVAAASAGVVLGLQGGSTQAGRLAVAGVKAHALPRHGVLVSGRSLAGVQLGDTMAQVRDLWGPGRHLARCHGCEPVVWYYTYPTGNPVGAGVQFSKGRVVAVFTLGRPKGWHTETGIEIGQVLKNPFNDPNDTSVVKDCAGFSAKSTRTAPNAVTSILTQGASVYGFVLTRPSVSPCQ